MWHQYNRTSRTANVHAKWSHLIQQLGDSGGFRARVVHERSDPRRAVNEFGCGDDILHPAVFHLRQEAESGYFCVRHTAQEEDQRCSILPLMACTVRRRVSTNQYGIRKVTIRIILVKNQNNVFHAPNLKSLYVFHISSLNLKSL